MRGAAFLAVVVALFDQTSGFVGLATHARARLSAPGFGGLHSFGECKASTQCQAAFCGGEAFFRMGSAVPGCSSLVTCHSPHPAGVQCQRVCSIDGMVVERMAGRPRIRGGPAALSMEAVGKTLVLGATGKVGGMVVRQLAAEGTPVLALARCVREHG